LRATAAQALAGMAPALVMVQALVGAAAVVEAGLPLPATKGVVAPLIVEAAPS
jgi:heme A synthase